MNNLGTIGHVVLMVFTFFNKPVKKSYPRCCAPTPVAPHRRTTITITRSIVR
jgi:hypothetical protein